MVKIICVWHRFISVENLAVAKCSKEKPNPQCSHQEGLLCRNCDSVTSITEHTCAYVSLLGWQHGCQDVRGLPATMVGHKGKSTSHLDISKDV